VLFEQTFFWLQLAISVSFTVFMIVIHRPQADTALSFHRAAGERAAPPVPVRARVL
jgi:hypothetical protein